MTQKQQQTVIVGVLAALLLLGAAYFFAIKPQLAQRADNNEQAELANSQAQTLQGELVSLQAKERALPEAEKELTALAAKFPAKYQQDEWFDMLLDAASSAGVTITAVAPTEPAAPADPTLATTPPQPTAPGQPGTATVPDDLMVAQAPVSIVASATSATTQKFVSLLENMDRPLLIDSVQYTWAAGQGGTVTITGKTFLSRALETPAGAETPAQ